MKCIGFVQCLLAPLLVLWFSSLANQPQTWAAPDDEVLTAEEAAVNVPQQEVLHLDANIFPGTNNAAAGRQRLQTRVNLRLAEIDRVCQLTEAQKKKLELAVRGDLARFMNEVEQLRRKFENLKNDPNAINQMWQEIQPLQARQATGLVDERSLLMKVLPKTLDSQQAASYQAVVHERRQVRYRASVAYSMTMLERVVPLRHQQRNALTNMLLEETEPPLAFGQHDHTLVMYRLAQLPTDKVEPLLDERQWRLLRQQVDRYRGMRSTLIQQGVIAQDEEQPAAGAERGQDVAEERR